MFTMIKSLAVLGVVAGSALVAQPAKADNFSFGFGVSSPSYYRPAYVPPVTYYSSPAYGYATPAYSYASPAYCPPPVVYSPPVVYAPAPVYYAAPSYYYSPRYYSAPVYYPRPGLSFNFGFGNWGGGRDRDHRR